MNGEDWIVVPNWDKFQHYKDRTPVWIKNYLELLQDDGYLGLTLAERGVLHGIWLLTASSRQVLRGTTASLSRKLNQRVSRRQLESLNHAGFITFVASKSVAQSRSRSRERKRKKRATPVAPGKRAPAAGSNKAKTQTPYQRARDWVLVNGWQLSDSDLHEILGAQFGIEAPLRAKLTELAGRLQQQQN